MRLSLGPDSAIERVGLLLNKVPVPAGQTFNAMAVARTIGVAQRVGVFAALAGHPRTIDELAQELALRSEPLRMMLDLLAGERLLDHRGSTYTVSHVARRWVDPESTTYIGTWIEHTLDYWPWWADLERVLRDGGSFEIHQADADDPSWPIYIRGQYELARLSAPAVAKAINLAASAASVLDIAGGHGWYAAALCQRNPALRASVIDLPGSVAVGRQIMKETQMDAVVTHQEGDLETADLGGPHDAVLCFSILHHLSPTQIDTLLTRACAALKPGGTLAVLDMFRPNPGQRRRSSAAIFELFFHLTSGVDTMSEAELGDHHTRTGFTAPKRHDLPTLPDLRLYTSTTSR